MKLLPDQGTPRDAAHWLREKGFDRVHTAEIALSRAIDPVILERARSEARGVVTLDSDFHIHLALQGASSPSMIRVRIPELGNREFAEIVACTLRECRVELEAGAAVSVDEHGARARLLPLP